MKKILLSLIITGISLIGFGQGNTPCTATALTSNTSCVLTAGTTVGATYQSNGNNGGAPTCASPGAPDVWYSFTPTTSGSYTFDTQAGTITDAGMGLYGGAACNSLSEITCDDDGGTGLMSQITATLTAGTTYYIRVWEYFSGEGTFDICITGGGGGGGSAPANDEPCSATGLTVGASCSFATYTTTGATNSSLSTSVTLPTCANFQGGDVWFSFTAPTSGHVIIDTDTGVITDAGMALYSGADCNNLSEVDCDDDGSANGLMSFIEQTTLVPGATYWVRVWEYGNDNPGTFDICIYDGGGVSTGPCSGGAGGSNCATMNPFCTSNTYCFTAQTGTTAEAGNNYGCLSTQPNPTWYYFEISTSGNLAFDMSAGSDIDFALWGPFNSLAAAQANCGSLGAPIDCSYSTSPTETGNVPSAVAGQVYVLLVTNYAGVVQDITINTGAGNSATTDCTIVNCGADAGSW